MDFNAIRKLAIDAGFNQHDADVAAAVALAESGGNPNAHNSKPPDNSYGLMQINMLGSLGPARRAKYKLSKNEDLYDPKTNMRVAFGIFKDAGARFGPWTTFTSGKYKQHLAEGSVPSQAIDAVKDKADAITDAVPNAINAFGQTLFKTTTNLTGIVIAGVLLALGVVILLRTQLGSAARTIAKVSPAGKAKTIAKMGRVL